MITADEFLTPAIARGWSSWTGVPCSFLTPLINGVASDRRLSYVPATSEGEAIAIAAGAWFAGRRAVAMMQNSGLGNAVNPLTSLCAPFRIPLLTLVTWRGQPGLKDEPQHELMGRITQQLLDTMEVAHAPFPTDAARIDAALDEAEASMHALSLPFCFVMEKDSVADAALNEPARSARPAGQGHDFTTRGTRPTRVALLERTLAVLPNDAAVIATTGKSGRELFTLADREQHLYCVGSMGGASAIGLGVALHADRPVVVIDGDGAALMKLGNLATIGAAAPARYVHVLLDNGVHDSTGGQATVSSGVDFAAVALACGYRAAFTTDDEDGFERALRQALTITGPVLLHARMAPGSMAKLGRPTVPPDAVARRFRAFVAPQAVAA
ncbi:phosphonopyruvate decarboxylase [Roseiterribacter gracilis]|uniref:Thiamine pyrophosphate enzyme n=1 Tax=Roseiterribacter gracilis TaxID=2812848 RepID=A0A8S8XHY0_9PROT|nr:thiamine pyrophosphate enzyme [Rhodospirillales bacterium TMPK1]